MKNGRKSLSILLVSLLVSVTAALILPGRTLGGSISYFATGGISDLGTRFPAILPQSDPSYGPLTSITYSGSETVYAQFVFNLGVSSAPYTTFGMFTFGDFGPTIIGSSGNFYMNPVFPEAVGTTFSVSGTIYPDSTFYGTGELSLLSYAYISIPQGYGFLFDRQENSFSYWVTYNYAGGIPEPPSLILASIGAVLPLSLFIRRRFARPAKFV